MPDELCTRRPAPCDTCFQKTLCGQNSTACRDYCAYVVQNRMQLRHREPSRALYLRLFNGEEAKSGAPTLGESLYA